MMANVLYALNEGHRNINNVVGRPFDHYAEAIAWGRSQLIGSPFVVADGPRQYLVDGDDVWVISLPARLPLQMKSQQCGRDHSPVPSWPSPGMMRRFLDDHRAGQSQPDASLGCVMTAIR